VALDITLDVTPHHALLNESLYRGPLASIARVNPPLRGEEDREAVYEALRKGVVNAVVTDHAPHQLEEKLSRDPPPGFPGLELALHLLLREVLEGRMPLSVLELYSLKPAALAGLRKGRIAPGFDADLVVVELREWVVRGSELVSKAKYTPFEGARLRTATAATYVRGQLVYHEGVFADKAVGTLATGDG